MMEMRGVTVASVLLALAGTAAAQDGANTWGVMPPLATVNFPEYGDYRLVLNVGMESGMVASGSDTLYYLTPGSGYGYRYLLRGRISTGAWEIISGAGENNPDVPDALFPGGPMAARPATDSVYAVLGRTPRLYRFDASARFWDPDSVPMPEGFTFPARIAETPLGIVSFQEESHGRLTLFLLEGTEWRALALPPQPWMTVDGISMTYSSSDNALYVLMPTSGAHDFMRYDFSSNIWTSLTLPGFSVGFSCSIASAADGHLYCFPGYSMGHGTTDAERVLFYRYDIAASGWTRMADTPGPIDGIEGGGCAALVCPSNSLRLFALRGYASNEFWCYEMEPVAPGAAADLRQLGPDGQPIRGYIPQVGGATSTSVTFEATVTQAQGLDTALQVILQTSAGTTVANVTSAEVSSGSKASVTVPDLPFGKAYQWKARAVSAGLTSPAWTPFGPSDPDFETRFNQAPDAPARLAQFKAAPGTSLATGALVTDDRRLVMLGVSGAVDPEGDEFRVEVEVRGTGEAFLGIPTASGAMGTSSEPSVLAEVARDGLQHWQARLVDAPGNASAWVAFEDGAPAFNFVPFGSNGPRHPCSAMAGMGAWLPLGLAILLIRSHTLHRAA